MQLFSDMTFTDFSQHLFPYTPSCPGPWRKVILDADFNVTAGRQFDRTASIWIAGTNVYFGTTAEPRATLSPSWHVERDITDLSAILKAPSTGQTVLGNIVNSTYTGVISASAKIEFYRARDDDRWGDDEDRDRDRNGAPRVPDVVYPLSGGPLGDNQYISTPMQPLTGTFSFPRNVEKAYLDVYLQSQIGDEFWYTCFPNDIASTLFNCGNTAFREGDVTIDGRAAGVAPVYPWIYTGGIDPYLWRPIPGVETFSFVPYRVNLTPFAAILNDGSQHTVSVTVFNNGNYFAANGALLLYLDKEASHDGGGLITDATSTLPNESVINGVVIANGDGKGKITTTGTHPVSITGYVDTSRGRITTSIRQSILFSNVQNVDITTDGSRFIQDIKQKTTIESDVSTLRGHGDDEGDRTSVHSSKEWPLNMNYAFVTNPDGSATQTTTVHQGKIQSTFARERDRIFESFLSNVVDAADTLTFPTSGPVTPSNGKTTQTYKYSNSKGICYGKTITAINYVLTSSMSTSCH
ncbi:MAG: peptide-N(4)-(N-acetyl-beta-glucosaminyl)asparagine amidase [Candidatus Eremiobacteraeota bacterium]|nr:peptide-N(4)-(N-acetyl-beta-glucosaminyl)asparagine amidase [Candidatus Eremiobacteraeota bacterium]